jgi:hypothetical protein
MMSFSCNPISYFRGYMVIPVLSWVSCQYVEFIVAVEIGL